jgi:hypothetical protein
MIRGSAGYFRCQVNPGLEFIDEDVDDLNRVVLVNPSSQHSGNSVLCLRSMPSTKHFIRPQAAESRLRESDETGRFSTARVIRN